MFGGMPDSPRGREIKSVEGSPSGIIARGTKIEELGKMMDTAADTLRNIKENSFAGGEQEGKAVEKLQETIGDSYQTLEEAADLYKPVGPVLVKYGEMLETYKPLIDNSASNCSDLWDIYESLPGDKDDSVTEDEGGVLGIGDTDKEEAAENQAKKDAYDNWENAAERFDTWYDVWEEGFDEAVSGISDGLSGSIEDGFWEALEDIIAVLEWAALVLGVLAIILAGPFAAIALALAALVLVGRIIQALGDHGSWADVGWAALGVLPFGKGGRILASMTKGGIHGAALGAGRFGKYAGKFLGGAKGFGKAFGRTFKQQFDFSAKFGLKSLGDIGLSALMGKTARELGDTFPGGKATFTGVWEAAHGTVGQLSNYNDWGFQIAGAAGSDAENWRTGTVLDVLW